MKKFRFPKNITTVHMPFMLHDFSPWQDQIRERLKWIHNEYQFGKNHRVGFEISSTEVADIIITR